jgi:hypothetical protein
LINEAGGGAESARRRVVGCQGVEALPGRSSVYVALRARVARIRRVEAGEIRHGSILA